MFGGFKINFYICGVIINLKKNVMSFKARLILAIIALVSFFIAIGLCLYWYDWKLLVILFILQFSWNIDRELKNTRESFKSKNNNL